MKNYEEVTKELLERRDRYVAEQKTKNKKKKIDECCRLS